MSDFPAIHADVFHTAKGTPYLKTPGVITLAKPSVNISGMYNFLKGFDPALNFINYLDDKDPLPDGEQLIKVAGQLCYMSFGDLRSKNKDTSKYLGNMKSSGHGSVFEHAVFVFLFYGISRSVTHELVRHRAGFGFSQVSQRYVSGKVLRFVERPEYQLYPHLDQEFQADIDYAAYKYEKRANDLLALQQDGSEILSAEAKTDLRKKVQQAARSVLPNETEAPIIVSGNGRSWRHFIEMRANEHAEIEIRRLAFNTFICLRQIAPIIFDDYQEINLPDGTKAINTLYRKV